MSDIPWARIDADNMSGASTCHRVSSQWLSLNWTLLNLVSSCSTFAISPWRVWNEHYAITGTTWSLVWDQCSCSTSILWPSSADARKAVRTWTIRLIRRRSIQTYRDFGYAFWVKFHHYGTPFVSQLRGEDQTVVILRRDCEVRLLFILFSYVLILICIGHIQDTLILRRDTSSSFSSRAGTIPIKTTLSFGLTEVLDVLLRWVSSWSSASHFLVISRNIFTYPASWRSLSGHWRQRSEILSRELVYKREYLLCRPAYWRGLLVRRIWRVSGK